MGQYELSTSRSKIFAKYGVGAYGKAIDTVNNEYINVEYSDQEVQEFMKLLPSKEFITEGATQFTRSRFFQHACFQREVLLKKFTNKSLDELYHSLKSNYSGELRDRIITTFFYENGIDAINADSLMSDALTVINNDKDKSILMMLGDKLLKGRPARNFSLPDTSGRMVSLSDFRGKVVFIDFWFTGCMACREYYVEDIAKAKEEFRESDDVVFLSVNVDNTRERWMKSVNDTVHRYTSPDIINLHTGGVGLHHPVIKDYNVRGYPAPILIDAEGKIFCASHYELRSRDGRKLIKTIYAALNK